MSREKEINNAALKLYPENISYSTIIEKLVDYNWADRQKFIAGANWADRNAWKDAESDDFPEIEREVIVLCQPYPLEGNEYTVSFAHRPDLENSGRYEPKVYGKGNWNIPNVKYWLNLDFPIKIKLL